MRNPHHVPRKAIVRRVRSCHGSDCPRGAHRVRESRCLILTRVDYTDGRPSEGWVSGDCQETCSRAFHRTMQAEGEALGADDADDPEPASERIYRKRHSFDPAKPLYYGGGFWERVSLLPLEAQ